MKTAVEQFLNAIKNQIPLSNEHLEMIESYASQAKEMEKEQIMDAYRINPNNENWSNSGIDYYNETFKSE